MVECPYCGGDAEMAARFCDRCGERLQFEEDRAGLLRRSSIQYLQGVRHGARPLDPGSSYHETLQTDLAAAIEDVSYLAGIEPLDLSTVIGVDENDLASLDREVSPDTDLRETDRRALGLAVLTGLLEGAYAGPTLDELRARVVDATE